MLITDDLARRIEGAQAADDAACAEIACSRDAGCDHAVKPLAGGYLVFCGPVSPLTHAIGVGMHCRVNEQDIDDMEEFFQKRDAPVVVDLTPHSDPSLREALFERGYHATEFTNMLVRAVRPDEIAPQSPTRAAVRLAAEHEGELFARTMLAGFMSRPELSDQEVELGKLLFGMPGMKPYLAQVDGEVAGAACLAIRDKLGNCFGDSTLVAFRDSGVHTALICARIAEAIASGCDLMIASTNPGSKSQRNYQRLGFEVAYSKLTMVLE